MNEEKKTALQQELTDDGLAKVTGGEEGHGYIGSICPACGHNVADLVPSGTHLQKKCTSCGHVYG